MIRWWLPAILGLAFMTACKKVEDTTISQLSADGDGAAEPSSAAHNLGKSSCSDCHDWNIVQVHNSSSSSYNSDCLSCHGDMSQETTLSGDVEPIHPTMCPYIYDAVGVDSMTNAVCVRCHAQTEFPVDDYGASGGALRKQVNVDNKCVGCHTISGPGKELYDN